jgi:hypothetical protein
MLLEGYINVKKQGDRTFHITCICEISSEQSISSSSSSGSVSLSTYMFQTKLPQVCCLSSHFSHVAVVFSVLYRLREGFFRLISSATLSVG